MSNILVHIGTNTFFNSLFELALELRKHDFKPLFYFDNKYPTIKNDLRNLDQNDIEYMIDENPRFLGLTDTDSLLKFITNKFINLFKIIDSRITSGIIFEFLRVVYKQKRVKKLYREKDFQHLIMASDLVQYDTGMLIKFAKKNSVHTLILPQFFANQKEAIEHCFHSSTNQISKKKYTFFLKFKRLSKWVVRYKESYLIRLPFKYLIVKEIFNLSPENPWLINTGRADTMAVEGIAVKNLFLRFHSYNYTKICVTGSLNTDKLYHNLFKRKYFKDKMYEEYKLDFNKEILIFAIPPDMFRSRKDSCEFNNYEEMISFCLKSVSKMDNYNVLFSLHPSLILEEHQLFREESFKILRNPIIEYIALVDLFIASISATIQWAIACGIPVINYDVYRYDYVDYTEMEAVVYTQKKDDFLNILNKFNVPDAKNKYVDIQKKYSKNWAQLDGNGVRRIIEILKINE